MTQNRRLSHAFALALAALLAAIALAAVALAAPEQTRESYKAAVEPICKKNTETNERLLGGVRKMIKEDKLKIAAAKFARAASAGKEAVKAIKAVAPPPADVAKLKKWIGYLEDEQRLLGEIGKALNNGNKRLTQTLSVKLTHNGNLANTAALGFDFRYCLIPTSQLG